MSANHHEGDSDNEIDANHVGEDQPKVSCPVIGLFKIRYDVGLIVSSSSFVRCYYT